MKNWKPWLPTIVNVLIIVAGVIVHFTPTDVDDKLLEKVKEALPIVLAQNEENLYSEESYPS